MKDGEQTQFAPKAEPPRELTTAWSNRSPSNQYYGNTHLVSGGGRLYTTVDQTVVALTPDGETAWSSEYPITDLAYVDGSLVGATENGTLILDAETGERTGLVTGLKIPDYGEFIGTATQSGYYVGLAQEQNLVAVSIADKSIAWKARFDSYGVHINDFVITNGKVYVWKFVEDGPPHVLSVFDLESGEETQTFEFPDLGYASPTYLTAGDDLLYAGVPVYGGGGTRYDYGFFAVDYSGSVKWTETEVNPIQRSTNGGIDPTPALDNKHLYVNSGDTIHALDRNTGEKSWSYPSTNGFHTTLAVTKNTVFAASESGARLHAIDAASGDASRISVELTGGTLSTPRPDVLPSKQGVFLAADSMYHLRHPDMIQTETTTSTE